MTEQDFSLKPHRAKIYSFYKKFSPSYAAAIMSDIDPYFLPDDSFTEVNLLENLLRHLAENKEFNSAEFVCSTYSNDWCESISSAELKEWALKSGYSWPLPDNPEENATQGNKEIVKEQSQEIERLKAENAELRSQLQDNAQRKSAVDSDDFSIYGHKSELLDILFKVIAEFWADSETPPKNSVIEQWIETNYPVKDYPYVSKAVRQYIATILRPQPKLK